MSSQPKPIPSPSVPFNTSLRSQLGSFSASSPLASASIARDIEDGASSPHSSSSSSDSESTVRPTHHDLAGTYRRPSFIAAGPRPTIAALSLPEQGYLSRREREAVRVEERSLLRDNKLIPPKHPRQGSEESRGGKGLGKRMSIPGLGRWIGHPEEDEEAVESGDADGRDGAAPREVDETTALLGGDPTLPYGGQDSREIIDKKWEEAVAAGKIHTTWQREAKVLAKYSRSLILTFILQYSLTVASVFTVGHIGKVELGAVSLASMTANITGYAVYQGLATSLDTLCAQAYGSGRKKLVGLQLQRMVYFLWCCTIPIGIIWLSGTAVLNAIVPEPETAVLAGLYLKVILAGAPGYAAFECGKRFVQAQGMFSATLYVLLICAPLNAFMNWLFVWQFKWGFIGAPIAVALTDTLLPLFLFLYVYLIAGRECWGGFTWRAFRNWGPMIRLALPGLVMVEAEFLAFEILTLSASWLSTTHLAAQSVVATVTALTYQVPFPVSIAASTRIANLIGATLADAAKTAAKVAMVAAVFIGLLNMVLLSSLRNWIPQLFTGDEGVIRLVASVLPLCAAFQLFDALTANCNGILRGLGRQEIGGYVNLFAYYAVAMPISFGMGFGLGWGLHGLWAGPAIALALVAALEGWWISRTSWKDAVDAAQRRNSMA
ncbi:hypothetical protein H2201_006129 [Coniosporium apollinis]|uniref:MATE family multidrug resistance protein n=2 Tax=Coniosporium TaxID=2810619 RepID=A0ABQ9NQD0_9PEZI|nr:hypothetical protein H2199_003681 [Cladosporium sp. JES 115]KAJ9662420.1 hypothetical protein H2201_006129 [Coniosporium apollinis]